MILLFRTDTLLAEALSGSRAADRQNGELRTALAQLKPVPSQTFVAWSTLFPYEAILPLERHEYLKDFRVVAVAAFNQSPVQHRMLAAQSIDDLHRALFEREEVFLISRYGEAFHGKLLTKYLAEHYGVAVTLTSALILPPLQFWRVHQDPPP